MDWQNIIPPFGLVGILGKRGMGKSALAYHLAELRHQTQGSRAAVFGPPGELQELLPPWFEVLDNLADITCLVDYTVIIDEGSIPLHIRRSMAREHVLFDQAMSLCRHRNQLLIVCSHHSSKLDILVIRDMDILAFKEPHTLHTKFERGEIREYSLAARTAFSTVLPTEKRRYSYVYYDDFERHGMVENNLATFWSEQISKAIGLGVGGPRRLTNDEALDIYHELYRLALELWDDNPALREILRVCGETLKPLAYGNRLSEDERVKLVSLLPQCEAVAGPWRRRVVSITSRLAPLTELPLTSILPRSVEFNKGG